MRATTKDLRLHTAEILAATDRGEQVIITYRGKGRALLTRWREEAGRAESPVRNPAFGLWQDRNEDVDTQVRRLRKGRELP
jgi:antitoxin (DNA-binding transcriptional repressor) of toxin-antitoxin stability system